MEIDFNFKLFDDIDTNSNRRLSKIEKQLMRCLWFNKLLLSRKQYLHKNNYRQMYWNFAFWIMFRVSKKLLPNYWQQMCWSLSRNHRPKLSNLLRQRNLFIMWRRKSFGKKSLQWYRTKCNIKLPVLFHQNKLC